MEEKKVYYTKELRSKNMAVVLERLNEITTLDFKSMIYSLADIIHSAFSNGAFVGMTREERMETSEKMQDTYNKIARVFNEQRHTKPEDIIILATLIMHVVEDAKIIEMEQLKQMDKKDETTL